MLKIGIYSELLENLKNRIGGAETQILKTVEYLHKLDCQILFLRCPEETLSCDLFIFFRFSDEVLDFFKRLPKNHPPYLISTVFWYQEIPLRYTATDFYDTISIGFRRFSRYLRGKKTTLRHFDQICRMIRNSSMLLPNSHAEMENIRQTFRLDASYRKIVNAVDHALLKTEESRISFSETPFIVSAGRIDDRKNRLNLVRGAKMTEYPLYIIGDVSDKPRYQKLYRKICREKKDDIHILGGMNQSQLVSYYRQARVHALPSFFETPGLASMEAAVFDCAVVVSAGGCTKEYFGDHAHYADPESPSDIREALNQAVKKGPSAELKEKILKDYTWEKAAFQTYSACLDVLGKKC